MLLGLDYKVDLNGPVSCNSGRNAHVSESELEILQNGVALSAPLLISPLTVGGLRQ